MPINKGDRKIISINGGQGTDPDVIARIEHLEDLQIKVTYYESVNAAVGTVSAPAGATILIDQFYNGIDAFVDTIVNGQPSGVPPSTAGGAIVDVATFDTSGNYTLSGTPSSFPVAIIYQFTIALVDYSNLTTANIIGAERVNTYGHANEILVGTGTGYSHYTDLTWDQTNKVFKTGSQASKGTQYGLQLLTHSGAANPMVTGGGPLANSNTIWLNQSTPANNNYTLQATTATTAINATSNVSIYHSNALIVDLNQSSFDFTPRAATTGTPTSFLFRTPLNIGQNATTETIGFRIDMATNSIQHATGAITTQRDVVIEARTHRFVAASVITNAATVAITGSPIAGTNATITNAMALWVQAGVTHFENTAGTRVLRLSSPAANDDPTEDTLFQKVTTTDATVTTIATIAIAASTTVMIEARVVARRTGGTSGTAEDGAAYIVTAAYKNVAGTATEIGETSMFTAEDQIGWNVSFAGSGANALLQVTGAANNNISWVVTYRVYQISI